MTLTAQKYSFVNRLKIINFADLNFLSAILFFALLIRVLGINYNSPYTDEAIYVVIGKLGVFQRDWWSYHAASWIGGSPYFYPTLTSVAYMAGGIMGSRLLNIVFCILTVELIYRITFYYSNNVVKNYIGAIAAAVVVAYSTTSIHVSKLATYDMPSFYFTTLGFYLILKANQKKEQNGKYYFLSAFFIILGLLTKIIVGIYLPIFCIYSYLIARKLSKNVQGKSKLFFWKRYFLTTVILGLLFYLITNFRPLLTFYQTQTSREATPLNVILEVYITTIAPVLLVYGVAVFGLISKKNFKFFFLTACLSLFPLIFHLATKRLAALDKHIFLSICFLSVGIGIGFNNLIDKFQVTKKITSLAVLVLLAVFSVLSIYQYERSDTTWKNSEKLSKFMSTNIKENNLVLAENGPEVILATYDMNFPLNTTTFDYFSYNSTSDLSAYQQAIVDGYFEYVQFENKRDSTSQRHNDVFQKISNDLGRNYSIAYTDENFTVYKRNF